MVSDKTVNTADGSLRESKLSHCREWRAPDNSEKPKSWDESLGKSWELEQDRMVRKNQRGLGAGGRAEVGKGLFVRFSLLCSWQTVACSAYSWGENPEQWVSVHRHRQAYRPVPVSSHYKAE